MEHTDSRWCRLFCIQKVGKQPGWAEPAAKAICIWRILTVNGARSSCIQKVGKRPGWAERAELAAKQMSATFGCRAQASSAQCIRGSPVGPKPERYDANTVGQKAKLVTFQAK